LLGHQPSDIKDYPNPILKKKLKFMVSGHWLTLLKNGCNSGIPNQTKPDSGIPWRICINLPLTFKKNEPKFSYYSARISHQFRRRQLQGFWQ
jgi:hypothetical protein